MTDHPKHVDIHEEGPRAGFQIEPGPISAAEKIKLIEALAETGLHHIQAASFVSPKIVPGWADAEEVVAGFTPREGVHDTGLWFNAAGLNRALVFRNKLTFPGRRSATRAICSPIRTFWRGAGSSMYLSRGLAKRAARSPACRPCQSSSVAIAAAPGLPASRHAWANTAPTCCTRPVSAPAKSPRSRRAA